MFNEEQLKIIKKYSKFKDLAKNHPKIAYLVCKNKARNFYPELVKLNRSDYSKETVIKCAQQCRTREDFHRTFRLFYYIAKDNGWLEEAMKGKLYHGENFTKYNLEVILKLCETVSSYSEFIEKYPGPYQQAFQKKLIPQIKAYFKQRDFSDFPPESELIEWLSKSIEVLSSPRLKQFLCLCTNKLSLKSIRKEIFKSAPRVVFSDERKQNNKRKSKESRKRTSSAVTKVTKEQITKLALTYNNKNLFKEQHPKLFAIARDNGFWKEISSHMVTDPSYWKNSPNNNRYSNEEIFALAAKCKFRQEFHFKYKGAYEAAIRRKILEEVCTHMPKPKESIGEQFVRRAFELHFKVKFYKIKPDWLINPKTNMRLELDGYNEELNIAFEVQGGYHFKNTRKIDPSKVQEKDNLKRIICKEKGVVLHQINYNKSLEEPYSYLKNKLGISKDILDKVFDDFTVNLTEEQLAAYRKIIPVNLLRSIKEISYQDFARVLNKLRRENLNNYQVCKVLQISRSHLQHRILRINQRKIPFINR